MKKLEDVQDKRILNKINNVLNSFSFIVLTDIASHSQSLILEIQETPLDIRTFKKFQEDKDDVEKYLLSIISDNFHEGFRLFVEEYLEDSSEEKE